MAHAEHAAYACAALQSAEAPVSGVIGICASRTCIMVTCQSEQRSRSLILRDVYPPMSQESVGGGSVAVCLSTLAAKNR